MRFESETERARDFVLPLPAGVSCGGWFGPTNA